MAGALRKLFVELNIKVNDEPLEKARKTLARFVKDIEKLKKVGFKGLEKDAKLTNQALESTEKSASKLEKNIGKAEKSTKKLSKNAKDAKKGFQGLNVALAGVAAGVASAVISFGLRGASDFLTNIVEQTNELSRWSGRLQIGARELESWLQLSSMFGASTDDVTDAFKELQLKARDALDGTKTYIDVFELIGISTDDLSENVNDLPALMDLFTTQLTRNTDVATQNFVADELMSDAGTRMIEVFRMGTPEITRRREALLAQNQATEQLIGENSEFMKSLAGLKIAYTNMRNRILVHVLPVLTQFIDGFKNLSTFIYNATQKSNILVAAVTVLGVAFAKSAALALVAWAPIIATWALWTLGIFVVVLLLDDLITTIRGGDSAIKSFLESLGAWSDVVYIFERIRNGFIQLWALITSIGAGIDQFFTRMALGIARIEAAFQRLRSVIAPMHQYFSTLTGVGQTSEEITGRGEIAQGRRVAAQAAETVRSIMTDYTSTIPGGEALSQGIRWIGGRQNQRRQQRRVVTDIERGRSRQRRENFEREQRIRQTSAGAMDSLFGGVPTDQMVADPYFSQETTINAPAQITVNITESENPERTQQLVEQGISNWRDQELRMVQSDLIPEGAR